MKGENSTRSGKKDTVVILGATKDSVFAIANTVIALEQHCPDFADCYHLYHDGIPSNDACALKKLSSKVHLELYSERDFFTKLNLTESNATCLSHYTHMAFARFEMFDLLKQYRNAIWLDFDMLLQKDISSILDYCPVGMAHGVRTLEEALGAPPAGCSKDLVCYNSGLIVVNDSIPGFESITADLYKSSSIYLETLTLADQGIVNLVLYQRGIEIKEIPSKQFGCPPEWLAAKNSAIVHTYGVDRRIWNHKSIRLAYPEWEVNNKVWEKAGGTPFTGKVNNPDRAPDSGGAFVQYFRRLNIYEAVHQKINEYPELIISSRVGADALTVKHRQDEAEKFRLEIKTASKMQVCIELFFTSEEFPWEGDGKKISVGEFTFHEEVENKSTRRFQIRVEDDAITAVLSNLLACDAMKSMFRDSFIRIALNWFSALWQR